MRRLALAVSLALVATATATAAHAADQVRAAGPFTAINVQGPISVTVDAGAGQQSVLVRGSDRFVDNVVSEVVDGELHLRMRDKSFKTISGEDRLVVVKMGQLRAFRVEGAGEIKLNNVRGERLDVNYRGAGRMVVNGKVDTFRMRAEGVGEVDTKALIARDADVRFQGVGDVKVYASDRLDVAVQGMGSLSYFGKPRSVNKSVSGLGSVSAAE